MAVAELQASGPQSANPVGAIPRDYNFAADVLQSNLDAGRANKPAYIDARGTLTYGQLADRVARFGAVLRSLGIQREERVLLALTDTIDWPTAFLGCLKAGVIAVPVNTLLTEDDYRFMLADSRAKCLVVSEALYPKFEKVIGENPDLAHVVVSGDNAQISKEFGHKRFEDLLSAAKPDPYTAPTTCDDMAFWLYTSGSTGKPKGAVHVHASLKLTADLYGTPVAGLKESDVCYSVAKLFFAYGLGNAMTFPLSVGATTVLLGDRPTPDGVAALLRKYPVTVFFAVPTFYAAFLAQSERAAEIGSQNPPLHFRRRGAAGGNRAQMERTLRRRDFRRPRHHRDAAHLSDQRAGRDQIRHHRQAGAGLRDQAHRRGRPAGEAGRDGRDVCARADQSRSCIGTTARSRARPSRANGRARATNISRMPTAITSAAAAPTTC